MDQLVGIKMNDGSGQYLRIIRTISSHTFHECTDFAHKLLKVRTAIRRHTNDYKNDIDGFVHAVLCDWLSRADGDPADEAVPRTWGALSLCVEEAGMDAALTKAIRERFDCPQGVLQYVKLCCGSVGTLEG